MVTTTSRLRAGVLASLLAMILAVATPSGAFAANKYSYYGSMYEFAIYACETPTNVQVKTSALSTTSGYRFNISGKSASSGSWIASGYVASTSGTSAYLAVNKIPGDTSITLRINKALSAAPGTGDAWDKKLWLSSIPNC